MTHTDLRPSRATVSWRNGVGKVKGEVKHAVPQPCRRPNLVEDLLYGSASVSSNGASMWPSVITIDTNISGAN